MRLRARLLLLILVSGEVKDGNVCAIRHFDFADLPVHGFGGSPGKGHFLCDFFPHVFFESMKRGSVSWVSVVFGSCVWFACLGYMFA